MKVYVKIENTENDIHTRVIDGISLIDAAVKVFRSLPVEFYGNKGIKPRIWCSELGFTSEEYEYIDTALVIKKAGFEFI